MRSRRVMLTKLLKIHENDIHFLRSMDQPARNLGTQQTPLNKICHLKNLQMIFIYFNPKILELRTPIHNFYRYSDFLVNEIKPDGSEVHLTTFDPPAIQEEVFKPALQNVTDLLPQQTWDEIAKLTDNPSSTVEISVTKMSKDERKYIHQKVKEVYGHTLTSNTIEKDGEKFISVHKPNNDTPKRAKNQWPKERGDFVHFSIYKENMDTPEAINLLAHKLLAKTCQRACIKKVFPNKISSAARTLRGLSAGDFEFCSSALQLGQLAGNRFQIVLRNVTGSDEQIDTAMNSLSKHGFLNYFGLQRFGTQSVSTHHIGIAFLKGNWQEAIELILKPRGKGENPKQQEMRELWWKTRDADKALKALKGRDKCIEGQLLLGLTKTHKNDLVNALEYIPRNSRLMYLHSYQSYIWNRVLSRRIQEFGLQPVEGDLVYAEEVPMEVVVDAEAEETEDAQATSTGLPAVRKISAAEVSQFSLQDVILPLPGHAVTYPDNAAAQWYEEFMAEDGLSSAALKQNIRHLQEGRSNPIQSYLEDAKFRALILDFCLPSSAYATMALREVLKCDTSVRHQTTLNSYSAAPTESADQASTVVETSKDEVNEKEVTSEATDTSVRHQTTLNSYSAAPTESADQESTVVETSKDEVNEKEETSDATNVSADPQ
ncbi:hypothetical protein B566_EDAN006815 [Ephemera danica]|nr:hypothetical protein B566_EDAN006815 [Ephemera danica]